MWARVEPILQGNATDIGVDTIDNRNFVETLPCRLSQALKGTG